MKGLSAKEEKALKTLNAAQIARVVFHAIEAGAHAPTLARQMGVTRQRVQQLKADGKELVEGERAATATMQGFYSHGREAS